MVRVVFTQVLARHFACPPSLSEAGTVREILDRVFAGNERARGYIVDERGALRKHVAVFINGEPVRDRLGLGDVVSAGSELYVMQALSGG